MGGTEMLLAPEPVAIQEPVAPPEDMGLTYQRADGMVEHAINSADAIARCPVLGKLALESPDTANMLLELAALGNAKLDAEKTKSEPETAKPTEKEESTLEVVAAEDKPEPVPKVEEPEPESLPTVVASPVPDKQLEMAEETVITPALPAPEPKQSKVEPPRVLSVPTPHVEEILVRHTEPEVPSAPEPPAEVRTAEVVDAVVEQLPPQASEQRDDIREYLDAAPIAVDPETPVVLDVRERMLEQQVDTINIDDQGVSETIPELLAGPELVERPMVNMLRIDELPMGVQSATEVMTSEEYVVDELSEQAAVPAEMLLQETSEQPEVYFEPEVIETYEALEAIINQVDAPEVEMSAELVASNDEDMHEPAAALVKVQESVSFETVLADSRQEAGPAPELPAIIEAAPEQPLEQTFVQLARYISEAPHTQQQESVEALEAAPAVDPTTTAIESQAPEMQLKIYTTLHEIAELLPECYEVNEETQEQQIHITPEVTEKLITLLRDLGYEEPKQALVQVVQDRGIEFVFQAVQHMVTQIDGRQEFATTIIMNDDDELGFSARLGNLMLKLLSLRGFATE